jgi:hypothetical protein
LWFELNTLRTQAAHALQLRRVLRVSWQTGKRG